MSGTDLSAAPPPESDDAPSTVELVGFGPSKAQTGMPHASVADAANYERRRRLRWILIGIALLLLAGISFLGPAVASHVKALRADQLARVAEADIANHQLAEAMATARTAFMISPGEPEVTRAVARTLSALEVPGAMSYWQWLLGPNQGTLEDRRDAAEYCLQQQDYGRARPIITDLLRQAPKSAPNLLLAARFCALTGDPVHALALGSQAQQVDPKSEPVRIFLALQELNNPYLHAQGVEQLESVADANDSYGLLALQRLAEEKNLDPTQLDHLIQRLKSHPLAGEAQRLTALGLEIRRQPAQRAQLIDRAMADHAGASTADRQAFARWLVTLHEPERVLTLIPLDEALGNQDLFSDYLDAMSELGQWSALRKILLDHKVPLEEPLVQLYLARCACELGDDKSEELYWRSAEIAAAHNPKLQLGLAVYAEQEGEKDRAAELYRLLTAEPLVARVAFEGLLRTIRRQGTPAQRDVLDQMAARYAGDPTVEGADIYLNLLLKDHLKEMGDRLGPLLQTNPDDLALRTDLALIELRTGHVADALAVFRVTPLDWTKAPVPTQVVYAATLEANGRHREARRILVPVDLDQLRPEERRLVRDVRS
jgi:hypothetical protein